MSSICDEKYDQIAQARSGWLLLFHCCRIAERLVNGEWYVGYYYDIKVTGYDLREPKTNAEGNLYSVFDIRLGNT